MNSAVKVTPRKTRSSRKIKDETVEVLGQKTIDKFFNRATNAQKFKQKKPNRRQLNFDNVCLDKIETIDLSTDTEEDFVVEQTKKRRTKTTKPKPKAKPKAPKKKNDVLSLMGIEHMETQNEFFKTTSFNSNSNKIHTPIKIKTESEIFSKIPYKKIKIETGEELKYLSNEPVLAILNKQCPDYKVVEGTTFSVDAFRFGNLEGVTHYFLTHFHCDHYIGLKKSFNCKLYTSQITANLVTAFIGVDSKFITVIEINKPVIINNVEITAIDANHCPGAVMFAFKLSNGKCLLHTGDFRASPDMESEPFFWNNKINTIYLDTTYLSVKYSFKPQHNSIDDAIDVIKDFQTKHIGSRILYVTGSYLIGKEKIWMKIAETFNLRVYLENNRRKAVNTIGDINMLKHLVDDPLQANLHVMPMQHITYLKLLEYLKQFNEHFDIILGLRPSGWEYKSKPRHQGAASLVGIEYSEHSSFKEMRRFVGFLQPDKIISTVPLKSNVWKTMAIPDSWYNNEVRPRRKQCQFSLLTYMRPLRENNSAVSPNVSETSLTCEHMPITHLKGFHDSNTLPLEVRSKIKSEPCHNSVYFCSENVLEFLNPENEEIYNDWMV